MRLKGCPALLHPLTIWPALVLCTLQRVAELAIPGRLPLLVPLTGIPRPEHQQQCTCCATAARQPSHVAAAAARPPRFVGISWGSSAGSSSHAGWF